jgi:hypothetical protein
MKRSWWTAIACCFLAATLSAPAWGANLPQPGVLNYFEGQASIGAQPLKPQSVGSAELMAGQTLTTQQGKAEVLLTPGVFFRLGDHSSAQMISPSLTYTEVRLQKGHAIVEVAEIHKQNDLRIAEDGVTTRLLKTGLYDFDANHGLIRIFKGKAAIEESDRRVELKGGREFVLNGLPEAQKFNKKEAEGDLYRWSSLRSEYLSEANPGAVRMYAWNGWYGPGWYWNPWFDGYTFIPGEGIVYSPFGWGFYSPWWMYQTPFVFGGYHYRHFGDFRHPDFDRGYETRGFERDERPALGMREGHDRDGFRGGLREGGGFHEGGRRG